MANKVVSIVNDKEKLKELGKNAKHISSDYSYEKVEKMWLGFIRSL